MRKPTPIVCALGTPGIKQGLWGAAMRGSPERQHGHSPKPLGVLGLASKSVTESSKTTVEVSSSQRVKLLREATRGIEHILLDGLFHLISSSLRCAGCLLLLCGAVSAPWGARQVGLSYSSSCLAWLPSGLGRRQQGEAEAAGPHSRATRPEWQTGSSDFSAAWHVSAHTESGTGGES